MNFRTARGKASPAPDRRRPRPDRRQTRPSFEALEGRVVLSQINWNTAVAPTGGAFDTASNWVGGVVPGSGDDAIIDLTGSGGTVILNAGDTDTINSLTTNAATTLDVSKGSLTINNVPSATPAGSIAGILQAAGGTLTILAPAAPSVAGPLVISGGTLALGTGTTAANVSTTSLNLSAGALSGPGTLTTSGADSWSGGSITNLTSEGTLAISGSSNDKNLYGTLINAGVATYSGTSSGGNIYGNGTATDIINQAGASFDITFAGNLSSNFGNGSTFTNAGTLDLNAPSSTAIIGFTLNNTGTVEVDAGTLDLVSGGGSLGGSLTAAAGTTLDISGSTYTAPAGATLSVAGTLEVSGGTLTLVQGVSASTTGPVVISGGTLNLGTGTAAVNLSAPTLALSAGALSGPGTLTTSGADSWSGGSITNLTSEGTLAISGSSNNKDLYGTLINAGVATYSGTSSGGNIYGNGTATIVNQAGASFDITFAGNIARNGGETFTNAGTLDVNAPSATAIVSFALNNTGTVEVDAGTLNLTGSFSNFSGTTLTGGQYVVSGTLMFTGANIVTNSANIVLNGSGSSIVNPSSVNALAGFATNGAAGSFTIQGGRNFTTAGAFANAGSLTVGGGSTFTASGAYSQSGGSTNLAGGTLASGSGVTLNGGSLNGVGTVSASVANTSGTVNPGGSGAVGTLTVTGGYSQGTNGVLDLELGGAASGQYDLLAVGGAVSLGGTLNVTLIGGYSPGLTDLLTPLTFASQTGNFATQNYPTLPGGATLTHVYLSTALQLGVTADVTSQTTVALGGLLYNRRTGQYTEAVTITNTGSAAILGPISLVLDNLTGASVVGASGTTSEVGQAGSSYVNVALSGGSLGVGQSVTFYLTFSDPSFAAIGYTPRVLAGDGSR